MFKTRITELLGIEYPILAGPMGPKISELELVAAVSNAGGLGILPALEYRHPDELREAIKKLKQMTKKPFAINVTLVPFYTEIGFDKWFTAAISEGVGIIETSARSPEPYMKLLKDANVKVIHRATRTKDIVTAEQVGVDAVTILGIEAGGLPGIEDVTSMVRIPIAKDTVSIPVIAGGGISDARGFVAALALGAEGVLMGTRFMLSKECKMHPEIRQRLIECQENETILTGRPFKYISRVIKSPLTQKILEMEQKGATWEEVYPQMEGRFGLKKGDPENTIISTGQVIGLIHDVPSVKEIIDNIINQAKEIIENLSSAITT
jgi:nitronate monooxygenase